MHVDMRRGFSFLELLIVGIVLLVLISIAIPRFNRARTFAAIAEVNSDMLELSTAIHDYRKTLEITGGVPVFPPSGLVSQGPPWSPWIDSVDFGHPNFENNNFHACSIVWVEGSFYNDQFDSSAGDAASPPSNSEHYDLRVMTSPMEVLSVASTRSLQAPGEF